MSDNEWQQVTKSVTTSDNEWQRVTTNYNEWYNEWKQVTRSDSLWFFQQIFLFSQIRNEPTTTHPKENYLNVEEDLEEDLVCDTYNFMKIVWHKHNVMISSFVGSGHPVKCSYEIPLNTYQSEGTSRVFGVFFFFKWQFLFSHMLRLFQNSFNFGEATSSHFSRVSTLTQQLLLRSSYFFRATGFFWEALFSEHSLFSKQLFFQNNYFSRVKLLPSSHFLRIESSLG